MCVCVCVCVCVYACGVWCVHVCACARVCECEEMSERVLCISVADPGVVRWVRTNHPSSS